MQLTLPLLRFKTSDQLGTSAIINSKVGDKDGGEVVVAAETGKKICFYQHICTYLKFEFL